MTSLRACLAQIAATENYYHFIDQEHEHVWEMEDWVARCQEELDVWSAQLQWLPVTAARGAIVGRLRIWRPSDRHPVWQLLLRLAA